MKKFLFSLAIGLLAFGSAFAAPQLKGLNNKNGKTTIIVEIGSSRNHGAWISGKVLNLWYENR